jgi:hypothetical protein
VAQPAKKLDPKLLRDLDAAGAEAPAAVQAVIYLHPPGGQLRVPPDVIQGTVDDLLGRVERAVGRPPARHNTFQNLGSFVVEADPGFVRELLRQPEVASAMANQQD